MGRATATVVVIVDRIGGGHWPIFVEMLLIGFPTSRMSIARMVVMCSTGMKMRMMSRSHSMWSMRKIAIVMIVISPVVVWRGLTRRGGADAVETCSVVVRVDASSDAQIECQFRSWMAGIGMTVGWLILMLWKMCL